MEDSDSVTVARVKAGDGDAYRALVDRHSRSVFRLAYRMTGNEQDAEDMVQETFLRAFKQLHRFDGRASFGTWLYRIAANCSLDLIRARRVRGERQPGLDATASPDPSPERVTRSKQLAGMLDQALEQLTEAERTAFLLRHYEGCNIEQIAKVLGVGNSAAKHSVFRAVQKLRCALEPAWGGAK
jgi:RNA polymerase sigma-70 factor (ECF subfamily)